MKVKPELLKRGPCPFCERRIIEANGKANRYYKEMWVKFDDGSIAAFAVCSDCHNNLNKERVEHLVRNQVYTYGYEIVELMSWFISSGCHLKLDKFAKEKNEL